MFLFLLHPSFLYYNYSVNGQNPASQAQAQFSFLVVPQTCIQRESSNFESNKLYIAISSHKRKITLQVLQPFNSLFQTGGKKIKKIRLQSTI